jgi:hypothetical protein
VLAKTKVDKKCEANNKSRVPKIAPVLLFNHVNFSANTQGRVYKSAWRKAYSINDCFLEF